MIQLLEKQRDNENKILTPLETFWTLLLKSKMCQTYYCFTVVKSENYSSINRTCKQSNYITSKLRSLEFNKSNIKPRDKYLKILIF